MRYLLLISCSQRKVQSAETLQAIDFYDGPVYRTLRKLRREGHMFENLDVLIISAAYKLIESRTYISGYNKRMTPQRAAELLPEVQKRLQWYTNHYGYDEVFINLGKTYMQTLDGFHWGLVSTLEASGGIGQRTSQTKAWLERIALSESPYIECVQEDNSEGKD